MALYILVSLAIALLLLAIVVLAVIQHVRKKLVANEMAKMLWKIPYRELVYLNDKSKRSKSLGSLRTITTAASDDTAEAIARGEKNAAHWRGTLVFAKVHNASLVLNTSADHQAMKELRDITCDNLNMCLGLCLDSPQPISVWRYCGKGSLEDILHNETIKLDWFFKYSLIKDICAGLDYLHSSPIKTHGRIKSSNCLVDSRWGCKVTDYGLGKLRVPTKDPKDRLWSAPELLRMQTPPVEGTQEGDVYSLAIVIQEVLCRDRPFCSEEGTPGDIVLRVAKSETPPYRPAITGRVSDDTEPAMIQLMNDAWKEDAALRPNMKQVKASVRAMCRGRAVNLMDHVLRMMEKYTGNLETTISERTKALSDEMKNSDVLLYRMLPKVIADKLKAGQSIEPEVYGEASVVVAELSQFEQVSVKSTPLQLVVLLNELYTQLDEVITEYDAYKVNTISEGYLVVSGMPALNEHKHAGILADMSMQFIATVKNFWIPHLPEEKLELRIAINTGELTGGVVGTTMPRFCVFGDTVKVAQRLEETGRSSCVHITEDTNRILTEITRGYITKPRGEIMVSGKGCVFTYWLLGKTSNNIMDHTGETTSSASGNTGNASTHGTEVDTMSVAASTVDSANKSSLDNHGAPAEKKPSAGGAPPKQAWLETADTQPASAGGDGAKGEPYRAGSAASSSRESQPAADADDKEPLFQRSAKPQGGSGAKPVDVQHQIEEIGLDE